MEFNVNSRATEANLRFFAKELMAIAEGVDFKISARGWCYQMEQERLINKDEFDKVEMLINKCRKKGILPVDFVAEEDARAFQGVERPEKETPLQYLKEYVEAPLECHDWYTPDWWEGEEYYIQILVEKIDLRTLFAPICKKFHIPIANSRGWSSIIQRAEYTKRFKKAEERGLKCILLYCGDHDPDGLRISDAIRKNLEDISEVYWDNGTQGYDPYHLHIERFGLNADFIREHNLTWIDNLITGNKGYIAHVVNGQIKQGRTKAGKPHPNYNHKYAQEYLAEFGVRKCEANALVPKPEIAREYIQSVIEGWLGKDALKRFKKKRQAVKDEMDTVRDAVGLNTSLEAAVRRIERFEEDGDDNE